MLLIPGVFAADMTWQCPSIAEPADAFGFEELDRTEALYREDSTSGPLGLFGLHTVQLETATDALAPGCPAEDYYSLSDACTLSENYHYDDCALEDTGTGEPTVTGSLAWSAQWTEWKCDSFDYYGGWSLDIDATSTVSTWSTLWAEGGCWDDRDHGHIERFECEESAAWAGSPDGVLPADSSYTWSMTGVSDDLYVASTWTAAWEDPACTWSVVVERDEAADLRSFTIDVLATRVEVVEEEACGDQLRRTGRVDDGEWVALDESWEPLVGTDADADGWYSDGGDCDDTRADVSPCGEDLTADGVDQDCDGADFADADGDGYSTAGGDCDDGDAGIHPGLSESCDGVDRDCDGADGVPEVAYDGLDQDCDGEDLADVDGDGHDAEVAGGDDCDDADPERSPSAAEVAYDGIDQDCDGGDLRDVDGDGHDAEIVGGDDCDDADAALAPGEEDVPGDGVDQDCDGADALEPETGEPASDSPGCGGGCASLLVLVGATKRRRR